MVVEANDYYWIEQQVVLDIDDKIVMDGRVVEVVKVQIVEIQLTVVKGFLMLVSFLLTNIDEAYWIQC